MTGSSHTLDQPGTPLMSFSMGDVSANGPFFTCRHTMYSVSHQSFRLEIPQACIRSLHSKVTGAFIYMLGCWQLHPKQLGLCTSLRTFLTKLTQLRYR